MKRFRVLVVDDSAYSRRTISRMLGGMSQVEVVGYAGDGEEGIRQVIALKPDLVTLDLEMPRMDGFTLLRILTTRFNIPVIIISASGEADKVFKALEMGALDFVAKPERTNSPALNLIELDLTQKISNILMNYRTDKQQTFKETALKSKSGRHKKRNAIDLVAIAASTGGPPALQNIFSGYDHSYPFGIVIAQHMPAGFTSAFAQRLNRSSHFEVREAEEGDLIKPGLALIAPGGKNMVLQRYGIDVHVQLVTPQPQDRYLPSADRLFCSCAEIYGPQMLAVVLTGMGSDGKEGALAVKEKGGLVLAESETTAVVYGMPKEVVASGAADRVVPLPGISQAILDMGGY
ncbi:MAG: chemotaxis-specific protein-glutamate methyltransferase CheB [Trichlorobacter sp.]|nr:chemotaxis-specific protein-glutamate methyltransferase CheB [Trichlorobacter sp.]